MCNRLTVAFLWGPENWGQIPIVFSRSRGLWTPCLLLGYGFVFWGLGAMVLMRSAWVLAMLAVTVLDLLPVEHLQLSVFDGWEVK